MKRRLQIGLILILIGTCLVSVAQTTIITGRITDQETKQPIPFANIYLEGSSIGVVSDLQGNYNLEISRTDFKEITFSYTGYKTIKRKIVIGERQQVNIRLAIDATLLQEVEVKSGKGRERYSNKNNPAVDLVREMIAHKEQNRVEHYAYSQYEQYEKLQMSLSNPSDDFKNRKLFRKYKWLFENVDTTSVEGKALLPIYLQEAITDEYIRRTPKLTRSVTKAKQKVSFDDYVDNSGLSNYLNYLYGDVDLYDNNISIFTIQFLSPLAESAPMFYKFYISDTLKNENPPVVELSFAPRNSTDFLFQGYLYVTMDGNYAVQRSKMTVNKNINLNWVRQLFIDQNFEKSDDGRYHLVKSRMRADYGLSKNGGGLFGERLVSFKNFKTNVALPEEFYKKEKETDVAPKEESYWSSHRHDTLTRAESKVYTNIDSLQKMSSFKRTMNLATLLLAGFRSFGPWELGPVNTFYSFNPVEGFRLRVGGRTTPKFNEHLYFETYAAYGFKDEKWKYFLSGTYSFTGRSIREFPLKKLRVSFQRDTKIPGQELQFIQEDNFLLSFKRGVNDKWLYNDIFNVDYLHEFDNHFSYAVGIKYWQQTAAGGLKFISEKEGGAAISNVTTGEISVEARWAPGEQFYQGKSYRIPIPNKHPIITARYIRGTNDFFNSQYNYRTVTLNVYKRIYLSQLGYTDMVAEGGYIFGSVPFPLLSIHRANQTYSYQLQSYNLMNFLEFVSDHYASLHFDHNFNGFIFNKIPLMKKLKLREVATLKILYGGIRNENNPVSNPSVFQFPTNESGQIITRSLASEPYMEASIGIANIFKLLRLDVVKRLTYLDNPGISEWGIRGRFKFDF